MLGYGVIAEPAQLYTEDGDYRHDQIIIGTLAELLDTAYEARPDFLALRLAVDDACLQSWWKLPDLPHEAIGGSVGRREAKQIPLDESKLPGDLQSAIVLARDRWAVIDEAFRQHGITLPEPEFILVNDWD
jgi:hypothetical protein